MLTAHQIIDETVEFYSKNPRSISSTRGCVYRGDNGERCALSRCCYEDTIFIEGATALDQVNLRFLPNYQGHTIDFWRDLQILHDNDEHWMPCRELSEQGKSRVKELKDRY